MKIIKLGENSWFGKLRYAFVFSPITNSFGYKKKRGDQVSRDTLVGLLEDLISSVVSVF